MGTAQHSTALHCTCGCGVWTSLACDCRLPSPCWVVRFKKKVAPDGAREMAQWVKPSLKSWVRRRVPITPALGGMEPGRLTLGVLWPTGLVKAKLQPGSVREPVSKSKRVRNREKHPALTCSLYARTHTRTHARMQVFITVCTHTYMHNMYMCAHMCIYVCVYVCILILTYDI